MKSHAIVPQRLTHLTFGIVPLGIVFACSGGEATPRPVGNTGTGATTATGATTSTGAGTTSTGAGTTSTGAGTTSTGAGTTSTGAGTTSTGAGTTSTGAGTTSTGAGTTSTGGSAGTATTPMTGGAAGSSGSVAMTSGSAGMPMVAGGGSGGTEPDPGSGGTPPDMGGMGGSMAGNDGSGGSSMAGGMMGPVCGNGMVEDGEECDGGDGCNPDCTMAMAGGLPTIDELFPAGDNGALDGRVIVTACAEANTQGTDCASDGAYLVTGGQGMKINCQGALDVQLAYPIGGTAGTTYTVTMHFYGIMEPKNYGQGVQREAAQRPGNQDDGADPTPWATAPGGHTYPVSDYNTYEIHVENNMGQEVGVYYLNADTSEGHWSYVVDYERQIEVVGGGTLRTRVYDRNCREIKNCGPNNTPAQQCSQIANNRVIDISAVQPAVPNAAADQGGLSQPALVNSRDAGSAGQWWLIDIISVDSMQ